MEKRFISTPELARMLDIPIGTVRRWRFIGEGPRGIKLGRHVRYDLADIERWLEARAEKPRAT